VSYLASVLADQPAAYWRLGAQAAGLDGLVLDSSSHNHHGSLVSAPALVDGLVGDGDQARDFDGIDDYITIPGSRLALSASGRREMTVECWVKTAVTPAEERFFLSKPKTAFSAYALSLHPAAPGRPLLRFGLAPDTVTQITGPTSITNGAAHHLVGVRTTLSASLYVDGVLVGTTSAPEAGIEDTDSFDLRLALHGFEFSADGGAYSGVLDEVAIYFRALSAERVAAHYWQVTPPVGGFGALIRCSKCGELYVEDPRYPHFCEPKNRSRR